MSEEKPKNFKMQKKVSTKQHGWTALVALILGLLFYNSIIGMILLIVGVISGIVWIVKTLASKKGSAKIK